jgi:hypothetical protein
MKKIIILTSILIISLFFLSGCSKPACDSDLSCGREYYSDNYCEGSTVKTDFITYTCLNPGTGQASCRESRKPELEKECIYPYKCEQGDCIEQSCYELDNSNWLGGPTSSRVFFDTPKKRNELIVLAMKTGAEFKVHLYLDKDGSPDRKLKSWGPLNDDSIDDFQWIRLNMDGVESMPPAYYWIGIEVMKYGDSAFNTCTTNDRKADTYGREDTITNGEFEELDDIRKTEHDMVYLFE